MAASSTSVSPPAPGTPPPGLVSLGGRPRAAEYVRAVWLRREFVYNLAAGELKSQHLNTALGNIWHILNPLLLIGVYYVIFGILFERTNADLVARGVSYIAFLSLGVFTFGYMQRCFTNGATSITGHIGLMRSLQFPRAVLPLATTTKETLSFAPSLVMMLAVLLLVGERPDWSWLLFAPVFVLMAMFSLGGAMVTARLTDHVADMKNVLPFFFRLCFYLSGVLFDVGQITRGRPNLEPLSDLFVLNPFYVFVTLPREYLLDMPSHTDPALLWLSATGWSTGLLFVGFLFFTAAEKRYGRG